VVGVKWCHVPSRDTNSGAARVSPPCSTRIYSTLKHRNIEMRQSWDEYFLTLAKHASTRATCDRLHAGCVIVKEKRIVSTGYNGSLPGADHCDEVGHLMINNHCVATEHAERNAVVLVITLKIQFGNISW